MDDTLTINGIEYIRKDLRDAPPEFGTVWSGNGCRVMVVRFAWTGHGIGAFTGGHEHGLVILKGPSKGRVFKDIVWPRFFSEHTQES